MININKLTAADVGRPVEWFYLDWPAGKVTGQGTLHSWLQTFIVVVLKYGTSVTIYADGARFTDVPYPQEGDNDEQG